MYSTMQEFRSAITATRKAVTLQFQDMILAADNGEGHEAWNSEWRDIDSARYRAVIAYWAALDVALSGIEKEWYALPHIDHDWSGPTEMSRWGTAVVLPSGARVHTDALHHELTSRPWPMAALRIHNLISEDEE